MSLGIDCASHAPPNGAMKTAQVEFVCRYATGRYAYDRVEVERIRAGGFEFVSIYETTANRSLGGRSIGVKDASTHLAAAKAAGMPNGSPLYFCANDWDAAASDQPKINDYFDGIVAVLGKSRVGAYGSYWVLKRLFDGGHISYGWQTTAWSGSRWDARVHIKQTGRNGKIGGISVDYDTSTKPDFGQWRTKVPKPQPKPKPKPVPKPKPLPKLKKLGANIFKFWRNPTGRKTPFGGKFWRSRS